MTLFIFWLIWVLVVLPLTMYFILEREMGRVLAPLDPIETTPPPARLREPIEGAEQGAATGTFIRLLVEEEKAA